MGAQNDILDRLLVLNTELCTALTAAETLAGEPNPLVVTPYRLMPIQIREQKSAILFAEVGGFQEQPSDSWFVTTRSFRIVALIRQLNHNKFDEDEVSLARSEVARFLDFAEGYYNDRRLLQTDNLDEMDALLWKMSISSGGSQILTNVNRYAYAGAVITLTITTAK